MLLTFMALCSAVVLGAESPPGAALEYTIRTTVAADVSVVEARLAAFTALEGNGRYGSSRLPDGALRVHFSFARGTPTGFAARLKALLDTPGRLAIWGCTTGPTDWLVAGARAAWKGEESEHGTVVVDFESDIPDAASLQSTLRPPKGVQVVIERWQDGRHRLIASETPAALTRADVANAKLKPDPVDPTPSIALTLTEHGKKVFGEVTSRCLKRLLPITFDGRALMVPVVREPITGGVAHITLGAWRREDALESPGEAMSVGAAALVGGMLEGKVTLE